LALPRHRPILRGVAVDVLSEIVIERPPAEVAGFAGDPSNAPKWY
jgi:hypothetical protein